MQLKLVRLDAVLQPVTTQVESGAARASQIIGQRHFFAAELGDTVLIGLSTVRFRSNKFRQVYCHLEQLNPQPTKVTTRLLNCIITEFNSGHRVANTLVCLATYIICPCSAHEVFIDDEQLAWFEATLQRCGSRPVVVFTHVRCSCWAWTSISPTLLPDVPMLLSHTDSSVRTSAAGATYGLWPAGCAGGMASFS